MLEFLRAGKKSRHKQEAKKLVTDDIRFSHDLWLHILIALVLGLGLGLFLNGIDFGEDLNSTVSEWLSLPGYIFIDLLKMIIIPLIISSIALGIAATHDPEFLKRLGLRIVPYYILTTAIAITIGLGLVHLIQPGSNIDPALLESTKTQVQTDFQTFDDLTIPQRIRNLIPVNMTAASYHSQMLQIVVFSLLLGLIILSMPKERTQTIKDLLFFAQSASMRVVGWALKLAPLAVFGLLSGITMKIGLDALLSMGIYMLTVIGGLICVLLVYAILVATLGGRNPLTFFAAIREVQLLAFSTSTSSGVMPLTMSAAEQKLGVDPSISRFVIPLGATINMDGTALYQGVAAVFLTQVFGIDLSFGQIIMLLITTIGASIGTPGTPGVGLVILATIITSIGVPPIGIALILGVDRLLDMCRTTINVTGDLTACVVMQKWLGHSHVLDNLNHQATEKGDQTPEH